MLSITVLFFNAGDTFCGLNEKIFIWEFGETILGWGAIDNIIYGT